MDSYLAKLMYLEEMKDLTLANMYLEETQDTRLARVILVMEHICQHKILQGLQIKTMALGPVAFQEVTAMESLA